MLLEDKEFKKSIPLQLKRGMGRDFAKRKKKKKKKIKNSLNFSKVLKPLPEVVDPRSHFRTKLWDSTFK